ncbi:MAG: hypothetical protein WCT18_01180 [Patescibacteria group bacterium]
MKKFTISMFIVIVCLMTMVAGCEIATATENDESSTPDFAGNDKTEQDTEQDIIATNDNNGEDSVILDEETAIENFKLEYAWLFDTWVISLPYDGNSWYMRFYPDEDPDHPADDEGNLQYIGWCPDENGELTDFSHGLCIVLKDEGGGFDLSGNFLVPLALPTGEIRFLPIPFEETEPVTEYYYETTGEPLILTFEELPTIDPQKNTGYFYYHSLETHKKEKAVICLLSCCTTTCKPEYN